MGKALLKAVRSAPLSSIQDTGRFAHERNGYTIAGAMDDFALRIGNRLVGNRENEAAIEMTYLGGEFIALQDCLIAVTGADFNPQVNGRNILMWQAMHVRENSLISFPQNRKGMRAYLCIQGGIDVPIILGSKSTDLKMGFGGLNGKKLGAGDIISGSGIYDEGFCGYVFPTATVNNNYFWDQEVTSIRVILGPEKEHFTAKGIDTFLNSTYCLSSLCDRQGYQFEGARVEHSEKGPNIVTNYTPLGAVQVPGEGIPIILMRDKQTTGGYPKIATVITPDISKLSQKAPGEKIAFRAINLEEAHKAYAEYENSISQTPLKRIRQTSAYNLKVNGKKFSVIIGEVEGKCQNTR